MTRAIVGGINPLDNEFYPLAVNSQGIAQIDTSGIPQPDNMVTGTWTPEYGSSVGGPTDIDATYLWNTGSYVRNSVWGELNLQLGMSACTILNEQGTIQIYNLPFTFKTLFSGASGFEITSTNGVAYGFNTDAPLSRMFALSNGAGNRLRVFNSTLLDTGGFRLRELETRELGVGSGGQLNVFYCTISGPIADAATSARQLAYPDPIEIETGTQ